MSFIQNCTQAVNKLDALLAVQSDHNEEMELTENDTIVGLCPRRLGK